MKKNTTRRLTLSRETIQRLDETALLQIPKGGVVCPRPDSMSGNDLATSACAPAGGQ
jgi:hypothetical protein